MAAGIRKGLDRGGLNLSFPGTALPANGDTGDEFAITPFVHGELPDSFAWQTGVLNGGTFSAINVTLEGSIDGTVWATLDTSTTVGGELRLVTGKKVRYIRAKKVSSTTGSGTPYLLVAIVA